LSHVPVAGNASELKGDHSSSDRAPTAAPWNPVDCWRASLHPSSFLENLPMIRAPVHLTLAHPRWLIESPRFLPGGRALPRKRIPNLDAGADFWVLVKVELVVGAMYRVDAGLRRRCSACSWSCVEVVRRCKDDCSWMACKADMLLSLERTSSVCWRCIAVVVLCFSPAGRSVSRLCGRSSRTSWSRKCTASAI
jgi:hypothetical protein